MAGSDHRGTGCTRIFHLEEKVTGYKPSMVGDMEVFIFFIMTLPGPPDT